MQIATIIPTPADWQQIDDIFEDAIGLDRAALHRAVRPGDTYHVLHDGPHMAGVYILRELPLSACLDPKRYPAVAKYQGRGVEGVMLGLRSQHRGQGHGLRLIELPKALGYDYVWGQALDSLNNLELWKKRREHLATFRGMIHVTAEKF